jgi:uncharacterized protein
LEEFSIRVAEQWKIGQKGLDNGAILLISQADRKLRIEVGYGLEGKLTDLMAGRIISGIIVPEFKAGHFDQGVVNGVQAMMDAVTGEFKAEDKEDSQGFDWSEFVPLLFKVAFFSFLLGLASRALGAVAGGLLMPYLAHRAFSPGLGILVLLAGIGVVLGFIVSVFAGLLRHSGPFEGGSPSEGGFSTDGGGFSGGGGFSRDDSSSGGGGFSGGGGGFGGGGASGSW